MQASSCPPVLPQLALEVMVNPPSPGDPSYKTYTRVNGKSLLWHFTYTKIFTSAAFSLVYFLRGFDAFTPGNHRLSFYLNRRRFFILRQLCPRMLSVLMSSWMIYQGSNASQWWQESFFISVCIYRLRW